MEDEYPKEDTDLLNETEEKNVYKKEVREDLVENDELSPQEDAFMQGYDEAEGPDEVEETEDLDENTEETKTE